MSFKVTIKIPDSIKYSKERIGTGFKAGIARSTGLVTNAAISNAPRITGNLKRSIQAQPIVTLGGKMLGKITQDPKVAKYGMFVEFGTGIHGSKGEMIKIVPTSKKALFWKGAKHPVKVIFSPGMKPDPYMRPALEKNIDKIELIMNEEIMKAAKGGV